jgi:hypothetical protein
MAGPRQPEEDAPRGPDPDPRYLAKDPRREAWALPAEGTKLPFNPKIAELCTQEYFDNWVAAHSSKDLFRFFRYALEYHDDLLQMVDDASVRVNELEEALEQAQATVTRLQRESEEDRLSKQNTSSISREPKRSAKLLDPLIFEGMDQDPESWRGKDPSRRNSQIISKMGLSHSWPTRFDYLRQRYPICVSCVEVPARKTGGHQQAVYCVHPQTDGQTERANQDVARYLRSCYNYIQDGSLT